MPAWKKCDLHDLVLVIDDSALVAAVVADMLEELGFSVKTARNVDDALIVIQSNPVRCIVSDIELPGDRNGYLFALDLKKTRPDVSVFLMTGNARRAAEAERDFSVLIKPFGLRDLGGVMRGIHREMPGDQDSE